MAENKTEDLVPPKKTLPHYFGTCLDFPKPTRNNQLFEKFAEIKAVRFKICSERYFGPNSVLFFFFLWAIFLNGAISLNLLFSNFPTLGYVQHVQMVTVFTVSLGELERCASM